MKVGTTVHRTLIPLFALIVVASAAAATLEGDGHSAQVRSGDHTCLDETTCTLPTATLTFQADEPTPDVDVEDRDRCLQRIVKDGEMQDPACEAREPSVQPGEVGLYFRVDGLDRLTAEQLGADQDDQAAGSAAVESAMGASELGALVAGAAGIGATGVLLGFGLRRFVLPLLAPLATRLRPQDLLDDDTRRRIYETVRETPGINLRGLADNLDLAWGTLLHHLHKLEKAHMVVSRRYGKYRRYFVNGCTYSVDEQEKLAALATRSTARVAEYIQSHPGTSQAEIGSALGVTASTILWHTRRLKQVGLVEARRDGRFVRYFPALHPVEQRAAAATA